MENLFIERRQGGIYPRVEALNVMGRARAIGASERTATRTTFGAIPPEVADTLADENFRGYEHRNVPFIAFTAAFVVFCLAGATLLLDTPWLLVAAVIGMFFLEDFYSGVLHIVLDDPRNIKSPLFARGALEFQAHHVLPKDIVRQPFLDVLGDLSPVVLYHLLILGVITQFQNPVVNVLLGLKLLYAWWGQFSHRMAHESPAKTAGWVKGLQRAGLMLRPETHKLHHTHYDRSFTITSGASNYVLDRVFRVMPNRHVWGALFMVLTAVDCVAFGWVLTRVFEPTAASVWTWSGLFGG